MNGKMRLLKICSGGAQRRRRSTIVHRGALGTAVPFQRRLRPPTGGLAQQAEQLHRTQQVGGSSPPSSTTNAIRGDES